MKKIQICLAVLLSAVFFVVFCASSSFAQVSKLKTVTTRPSDSSGKSDGEMLAIKKITGVGPRAKVQTPVYSTSVSRGMAPPQLWGQIEVVYETGRAEEDGWLDDLTFHYYALALKVSGNDKAYSFYKHNVFYIDVAFSRRPLLHRSAAYIRPSTIQRYGDLVGVAVEVSYRGQIIAKMSEELPGVKLPPDDWWKNPLVTESPITVTRDGCILDKAHSPFALINIDDYEVIK